MLTIAALARVQTYLLTLFAALAAPVGDPPPDLAEPPDESASASARACVVWARAHVTECTNAIDGTPSFLSHSLCADGCGNTWEEAQTYAVGSLSTQTCLGPSWGCCLYNVDQNFNACGQ